MAIAQRAQFLQPARAWIPYFILLLGLAITAGGTVHVHRSTAARNWHRFDHAVEEIHKDIISRMDMYIGYLRAGAGLFAASDKVTHVEWKEFVDRLELDDYSPGVQGIGYSRRIQPGQEDQVLRELQERFPNGPIELRPAHDESERHAIVFLEPQNERNEKAFGYDMFHDPTRRAAMERARDEATPCASAKVKLVQELDENNPPAGFLIYVPVYAGGQPPDTISQRRNHLQGFVYSPYRMGNLLEAIFEENPPMTVRFDVYDGANPDPQQRMYISLPDEGYRPRFHARRPLVVAGRQWTMDFWSRPRFEVEVGRDLTPFVAAAGLVLSVMLFMVTRSQTGARRAAERTAAELRANEQALRLSEARFRRLAESNLIGVVFCDVHGRISRANLEFFRLIRHDRVEVIAGRVRMDTISAPESVAADAVAMAQLRTVGVAEPYEKELLRPDGSRVPVLIGMAMLEGSTTELVAFCIDLTESKQAARELQRAKEQAEAANQAKDQFLAVLSHELRTPLTPVLALATAGQSDPDLPEEVRSDFAMIRRNVELEAKLIDDLLDLTRIGRGKISLHMETVDVHQAIRHAINVCSEELSMKRLSLGVELHATRHYARGDAGRLQQIFWNLLKNAIKFTPAGGAISLATSNPSPERIVVSVSDSGIGIETQALPRIFDAFEQGEMAIERNLGGLGLGLAISKGLVVAHGGTITAHSEGRGRGATFTVALQTVAALVREPVTGFLPQPEAASRLSILLVEDHPDTSLALKRLLSTHGYKVLAADSVEAALDLAARTNFDVIVSDLGLPDGSGLELMRQIGVIRRTNPPKGIALTGFGMEEDVIKSREAGFSEHLTKPVNFQNLQQAIERVTAGV